MVCVYLALGSNLGDRHRYLREAVVAVAAWPNTKLVQESPVYDTEPVGGPAGQPIFLNQVIAIETGLTVEDVLARTQDLEAQAGRDSAEARVKDGPRTLDLDILIYGDEQIDQSGLTVPHPRMCERLFVMEPLNDIAPNLVLPGQGVTVLRLTTRLQSDRSHGAK